MSAFWPRLEKLAKLPHEEDRGWHSVRRRLATDLHYQPLAVAAAILGHSPAVLSGTNEQPGADTLREGIRKRLRAGHHRTDSCSTGVCLARSHGPEVLERS
jgi:hypothetical protein